MQVNSKKTYDFFRDETHTMAGEVLHLPKTGLNFVEVPEWLNENAHFQAAVADGSILIGVITSKVTAPAPLSEPEKVGLGGWIEMDGKTGETVKAVEQPEAPKSSGSARTHPEGTG